MRKLIRFLLVFYFLYLRARFGTVFVTYRGGDFATLTILNSVPVLGKKRWGLIMIKNIEKNNNLQSGTGYSRIANE